MAGGQVGDTGELVTTDGTFRVEDAKVPLAGLISHRGLLESGSLSVGETVHASIDHLRRERIRRNHTATHLLHWALRLVLGEHVKQSGSFVAPEAGLILLAIVVLAIALRARRRAAHKGAHATGPSASNSAEQVAGADRPGTAGPPGADVRYCTECGTAGAAGAEYCASYGAKLIR